VHEHCHRLVRLLPEPALLVDPAGRVLLANDAVATLAGVAARSLQQVSLATLVADPADKVADFLRLCARSRQLVPGAFRWLADGGKLVEMRCDGVVLVPRSETAGGVLFVRGRPRDEATDQFSLLNRKIESLSREILERQKVQRDRDRLLERERAARADAENMSRVKDEFLATLSHELRTPLNAILGWSQVLLRSAPAPEQGPGLAAIERNARAQAKIIDDLLDMSRIVSGKIRLDVQTVALAPLIEAVVGSLAPAADAKSLRLHATLDPLAGPVKGDPNRLQQVVWNLLSNAIKFTPRHGRVQVALERVNSHVEIGVTDTGEGIEPDFLPHVFDRFQQADGSTTRRHGGLGLGLSIVRQLVELHGGSVRAKSPGPGLGATFVVALPVLSAHESTGESGRFRRHPSEGGSGAEPGPDVPADALAGMRLLVVDDEPDARELLTAVLQARGATVQTAASVEAALAVVAESSQALHAVLCDVGMPGRDGYEFARALRALPAEQGGRLPLLAVTAFARGEDRTRALLAGFNAHLAKPVDGLELVAVVASLGGRLGGASR
jgi:signal transduction histidine kinase/CheY-like chemotaxis protein